MFRTVFPSIIRDYSLSLCLLRVLKEWDMKTKTSLKFIVKTWRKLIQRVTSLLESNNFSIKFSPYLNLHIRIPFTTPMCWKINNTLTYG